MQKNSNNLAVSFKNITKRFDNLIANDAISFDIKSGTVHAIVGENGAGKSTIVKILYGTQTPTSGAIEIFGNQEFIANSEKAIRLGIGMVHQHFMLINAMSVLDNILLSFPQTRFGIIDRAKINKIIAEKSEEYDLHFDLNQQIRNLSVGTKQRLEIFKAILLDTKIIIFDEPTSVLTKPEVETLFVIINQLRKNGKTIIIITHKLDEVMTISDEITVLRGGKHIKNLSTKSTTIDEIAGLMVGHKIPPAVHPDNNYGEKILDVKNLNYSLKGKKIIDNVNLTIRSGEILGIAGISGNAQSELEQILSGMITSGVTGEIIYENENLLGKSAAYFRSKAIAHVPSDRTKWGYISQWSNYKNSYLGYQFLERFNKYAVWMEFDIINKFAVDIINKFKVQPSSITPLTKRLSGGNQQKLIVGREMESRPKFLIIAEPTQGVDIGSVAFIHQQILDAKKQGKAVLLISSELDEIKELADNSYVIYQGKIVGKIDWDKDSENKIGCMMIGREV